MTAGTLRHYPAIAATELGAHGRTRTGGLVTLGAAVVASVSADNLYLWERGTHRRNSPDR